MNNSKKQILITNLSEHINELKKQHIAPVYSDKKKNDDGDSELIRIRKRKEREYDLER
jgi:hypothetical protein